MKKRYPDVPFTLSWTDCVVDPAGLSALHSYIPVWTWLTRGITRTVPLDPIFVIEIPVSAVIFLP